MDRDFSEQPVKVFSLVAVLLFVSALAACLLLTNSITLFQSVLIAINLSTFVICGYDKMIAGSTVVRVPEKIFLVLAFIGGTVGLLIAMNVFHHKTRKASFLLKLLVILALQIVLLKFYGVEILSLI